MPKEPPHRIQTKYDRLEYILIEQDKIVKEFESQTKDITDDFNAWIQKNLPDYPSHNVKKGRKRNIEAILEKNEDCDSPVDSNSSETEDPRRKQCNEENPDQNRNQQTVLNGNDDGKRSKRAASKAAEHLISKQVNISIGQKMRRPDSVTKFEVQIKKEKLSLTSSNGIEKTNDEKKDEFAVPKDVPRRPKKLIKYDEPKPNNDLQNVVIKQEKEDKERSTRKARTKNATKNKTQRDRSKQRSSDQTDDEDDVQIEIPKGIILTVSDSEDEIENNDKNKPKAKKISVVDKSVNESSEKTELKNANETGNEQSVYEDAEDQVSTNAVQSPSLVQKCFVRLENIDSQYANLTYNVRNESINEAKELENKKMPDTKHQTAMNNTVTLNKDTPMNNTITLNKDAPMNNTMVLSKEIPMNNTVVLHKDTPDRCFESSPLKTLNDNTFNIKDQDAMFRNKKEKDANEEPAQPPQRITRTKKKAIDAAAAAAAHTEGKENVYKKDDESHNTKTTKHQTPNVPLHSDSSKTKSKLNNIVTNMESFIPKTGSAIKLLKSELREKREEDTRKKLEKEEEVQKKKEAMMLAKVEEQKKKREEKALRAQQTREQMEKERQMKVEKEEREKQEKLKQIQAEREAYKKELARKRALAEKRAQENEERRRVEDVCRQQRLQQEQEEAEKRLEAQRKRDEEELEKRRLQEEYEQAKAKARVLKLAAKSKQLLKTKKGEEDTPAPKTETVFDLDTDAESEDEEHPKRPVPMWSKLPYRAHALEKQLQVPSKIISDLFGSKPTSIDLRAIFPNISENRLRRQSSAVWNTPPRYSLMPKEY